MKYIVAGNYTRFAVTLTQKSGELIVPYIPTEGDVVQISLYGARRFDYPNYEQAQNVLTFEDNGCLQVGLYCLEVKITEANTHKLRCMYREQIRVVASNDDVPTDASFSDDDIQLSGQFDIVASTEIVVDDELSLTSTNPVQNKVVTAALNNKFNDFYYEQLPTNIEIKFYKGGEYYDSVVLDLVGQNAGLMSPSDKAKLDGIEAGANKTIVDDALSTTSESPVQNKVVTTALNRKVDGAVLLTDNDGIDITLYAGDVPITELYISKATSTTIGLMSAADKTKLDALPTNSDLQTALNAKGGTLAGDMTAAGYEIDLKSGNTSLSQVYIPFATAQADGLMSASDYSKLAGIATGATRVIVDSTFDTTSSNAISNSAVATALGDIDTILDNILGN